VLVAKFHQGFQFISNGAVAAILSVIGTLLALPPFLQAICRNADQADGADLVKHRIVVIGRYGPALDVR